MTRRAAAEPDSNFVIPMSTALGPFGDDEPDDDELTAQIPAAVTYIVIAPCAVVKGARGSAGTFYEGQTLRPWLCDNGQDAAEPDEIARLVGLGFLRAV